jgi:Protein of unknown function (DUF4230)
MTIQSNVRRIVVFLLAISVVAAGLLLWRARNIATQIAKPTETQIDLGAVTTRIRNLNRLETASMHVVHVSTIRQDYKLIPSSIAGDEITLFAGGDVIAGIDLAQLKNGDLSRAPDGTVIVRLPPPVVLLTRIDNRETRVVSRKTGLLRRADPGLEGRARLYAEGGVRSEAVRKGILPLAKNNAQLRIAELLHAVGIMRVTFVESSIAPSRSPS